MLGAVSRAFSALKVFGCRTQGDSPYRSERAGLCPGLGCGTLSGCALAKPAPLWVEVPHAELDCSRRKRASALRPRGQGVSRVPSNRQAVMKMNHIL